MFTLWHTNFVQPLCFIVQNFGPIYHQALDFNKNLFMQCHDVALMEEDDRLGELLEIQRIGVSASHVLVWQCWDLV